MPGGGPYAWYVSQYNTLVYVLKWNKVEGCQIAIKFSFSRGCYTAEGRSCFCADEVVLMEKCGVLYRRREVVFLC